MSELEARIRKRNDLSDTQIQGRLKIAKDEIDHSKEDNDNFYDQIFINDSLEETFEKLDAYLFGTNEASKDDSNLASKNVEMSEDAPPEGSVPTTALESTPS
jgi:guanylate kinase